MRKPRDYDAELKALNDKTRQLKARRQSQLVIATGADAIPIEELAGVLLGATKADPATKEARRKRGTAFFQGRGTSQNPVTNSGQRAGGEPGSPAPDDSSAQPPAGKPGAA